MADKPYEPRGSFLLKPIEIFARSNECSPVDTNASCGDYIKFYNHTDQPIDFSDVRLRIGYKGQAVSKQNTIITSGVVEPGQYAIFATTSDGSLLHLPNSGAFVWLEDEQGLLVYESTIVQYPGGRSKEGLSWAIGSDGVWGWAYPQPSGANVLVPAEEDPPRQNEDQAPCPEGKERNPETGRCRTVKTRQAAVKPCPAGKERNPATGRCRKITGSAALVASKACGVGEYRHSQTGRCRKLMTAASRKPLTPCKPGQERNPATGRCRSSARLAVVKKPCPAGQERNPATGRCRKLVAGIVGDARQFPVENTPSANDTIAAWWALGGIGTLAVGYAGWEWRREIAAKIIQIKNFFISSK